MLQRGSRVVRLVEPCLPSPAKAPPSGPGWLHEIGVRLVTRNGNDFTKRFPLVVAAIAAGALLLDRRRSHRQRRGRVRHSEMRWIDEHIQRLEEEPEETL